MEGPKTLPLTLDKLSLTGDEISRLEAQGYLKISDKKYYLPEIIRLALGFTYERGARPKCYHYSYSNNDRAVALAKMFAGRRPRSMFQ